MKVAFDENIPIGMVRVFQTLAAEGQILEAEIHYAGDYRPTGERGDENWIVRFAKDGGNVIVSGDERMRSLPQERAALAQTGMITFFFDSQWSSKNFFVKAAMLLNWWPKIMDVAKNSEPGQCWQIPFAWNWTNMRDVTPPTTETTERRR